MRSVLVLFCLLLAGSLRSGFAASEEASLTNSFSERAFGRAQNLVAKQLHQFFTPSIEAKESLAFILLPAIVAQEVLYHNAPGTVGRDSASQTPKGIEFDGMISFSSNESAAGAILFVRYVVTSDSYHLGVIWCEPNGRAFNYPVYPPSLIISSDKDCFKLQNDLFPEYVQQFRKPLGREQYFTNMFGDYPLFSIRYAEAESAGFNLLVDRDNMVGMIAGTTQPSYEGGLPEFQVCSVLTNKQQVQLDLANAFGREVKYVYSSEDTGERLQRKIVSFGPEATHVRLNGDGAKARMNGRVVVVRDFRLVKETSSERHIRIEYGRHSFFSGTQNLPVSLLDYSRSEGEPTRCARLSAFRVLSLEEAHCRMFDAAAWSERDLLDRAVMSKHWLSSNISSEDKAVLSARLEKVRLNLVSNNYSVGEALKELNKAMDLSRLLGDSASFLGFYERYKSLHK